MTVAHPAPEPDLFDPHPFLSVPPEGQPEAGREWWRGAPGFPNPPGETRAGEHRPPHPQGTRPSMEDQRSSGQEADLESLHVPSSLVGILFRENGGIPRERSTVREKENDEAA